jgi:arylsulfatase A-like enzyme
MVRDARWKYVHWSSGHRPQLFDLAADPKEFHDLGADPALEGVREAMRDRLLALVLRPEAPHHPHLGRG